jgi:predicted O-methyltransferase YrrM
MSSTSTSPPEQQAATDHALIDAFVRRGIFETTDFQSFWSQFVGELTCKLHRLPTDDAHLRLKGQIAIHWLRAFLCNFYEDTAEAFYWQPGRLRQAVYYAAMELGIQILPVYPYSPAPDPRRLPASLWTENSALLGLQIDLEKCSEFVRALARDFRAEYEAIPRQRPAGSPPWTYCATNGYFDGVDGYILYSMIRRFRPRRIVEIGSGNSTYLAAQAAARNSEDDGGRICEITAIEPYPNAVLRAGFPGLTRLVQSIVQEVPLAEFAALGENDILFIDSSHVLRTGSDVAYEFLEILPRLKKGVLVHVHDIFLPREYPRDWVLGMNRYWTEQYVLQAFLAFNNSFEVILPTAYLHAEAPQVLEESFSGFKSDGGWIPSSFWMRKVQ